MRTFTILLCCVTLTACVSADCVKDCYIVEPWKHDPKLDWKCSTGSVDPRCDEYDSSWKVGY